MQAIDVLGYEGELGKLILPAHNCFVCGVRCQVSENIAPVVEPFPYCGHKSRLTICADEITSKGRPFHTAELPPPRKVGTPDSADIPAPVRTSRRWAVANRSRSSTGISEAVVSCMLGLRW
jgi:hypothetical protein